MTDVTMLKAVFEEDRAGAFALEEAKAAQAREERALGFWIYLMSDATIFALLFATYAVMVNRTAAGPEPHALFDLTHTFIETMFLLLSSVVFGFSSLTARDGNKSGVVLWLGAAFLFGLGFVIMEAVEFQGLIAAGAGPARSGFLSAFFTLVGTHGLHVSSGLIWIAVIIAQIFIKGLTPAVLSRHYRLGLFWHFLDIIWVGIFSFVYLAGVV